MLRKYRILAVSTLWIVKPYHAMSFFHRGQRGWVGSLPPFALPGALLMLGEI